MSGIKRISKNEIIVFYIFWKEGNGWNIFVIKETETFVLKLLINQTSSFESDSNSGFNFILIFYIKSRINFRHEMSTRENLNLKIDIFEIYNVYKYIKYSVFYAGLAFSKNQSEEWYPMKI